MSGMTTASEPPDPADRRPHRFPLPPHPIAAEQARILTRSAMADWDVHSIADDALLIAVELVANAVKLGEVFYLTLTCQSSGVLIEVTDSSEASPERQQRSFDRVDGRGLLLVEAYSKDWGWRLEATGGKTVWALVSGPDIEPSAAVAELPPLRM
jgi:hypothetical protein